jgi:hypothetical protein
MFVCPLYALFAFPDEVFSIHVQLFILVKLFNERTLPGVQHYNKLKLLLELKLSLDDFQVASGCYRLGRAYAEAVAFFNLNAPKSAAPLFAFVKLIIF